MIKKIRSVIPLLLILCLLQPVWSYKTHKATIIGDEEKVRQAQLESEADPTVCLHYLGHASFILQFDNGVTILTDYGKSNSYGLDSPINGFGELRPDVVTYSHQHEDHAGGEMPPDVPYVLKAGETLNLKGLKITAVPTFESSLEKPDNFSYLFSYEGIKILHMGDCQGLIMGIEREDIKARIKQMYPGVYDLVLLPIGYVSDIVQPAAEFAALLRTKRLIPIHYWNEEEKARFLSLMRVKKSEAGISLEVVDSDDGRLCLYPSSGGDLPIKVIGLNAAPYSSPGEIRTPHYWIRRSML